ncbi:MAG: peptidase [Phenylobacterium sp.]|nr:peptidase [Phenylobacterium sp.]
MTNASSHLQVGDRVTWFLVGLLLAWNVAQGAVLDFQDRSQAPGVANAVFLLGVLLSLLAHDLAQRLVARAAGLPVHPGVLSPEPGHDMREQPRACAAELAMAAAGPVVSALLSLAVIAVARVAYVAGLADPVIRALAAVASFNILVMVANLLPILPMDGGRLLRAVIWRRGRDFERATSAASVVSKVAALLIIAAGLAAALVDNVGDALSWILVGVFLHANARMELSRVAARHGLADEAERARANERAGGPRPLCRLG